MSTLTSTLNDLEMNLDAIEDMMESMARILEAVPGTPAESDREGDDEQE